MARSRLGHGPVTALSRRGAARPRLGHGVGSVTARLWLGHGMVTDRSRTGHGSVTAMAAHCPLADRPHRARRGSRPRRRFPAPPAAPGRRLAGPGADASRQGRVTARSRPGHGRVMAGCSQRLPIGKVTGQRSPALPEPTGPAGPACDGPPPDRGHAAPRRLAGPVPGPGFSPGRAGGDCPTRRAAGTRRRPPARDGPFPSPWGVAEAVTDAGRDSEASVSRTVWAGSESLSESDAEPWGRPTLSSQGRVEPESFE